MEAEGQRVAAIRVITAIHLLMKISRLKASPMLGSNSVVKRVRKNPIVYIIESNDPVKERLPCNISMKIALQISLAPKPII